MMAKIMVGHYNYCSISTPERGEKYYRAYLFDPRKHEIFKFSRRRFARAREARGYSDMVSARYERLLTAAGLYGRVGS